MKGNREQDGSLPEGWATAILADFCESWGGATPSTDEASTGARGCLGFPQKTLSHGALRPRKIRSQRPLLKKLGCESARVVLCWL